MRPHRIVGLIALAAGLALLPACQKGSGKLHVAFVSNNVADFWRIAEAGCRKAEKEFDVEVTFRMPSEGTAAEQKQIIDDLVAQGVKAIAVSVINPKDQASYINRIAEQIPFIAQDNDAPDTKRVCYIGTDNYEAGKAAGRLVKDAMPDGGVIAIFVGQIEPLNARERMQGVLDELAGQKDAKGPNFGKYTLYNWSGENVYKAAATDNVNSSTAKQNVTLALNALTDTPPERICMVGLWAPNPPAILSAVKDASTPERVTLDKVKIVGFDENFATLDGIAEGHIHGSVVQNPYEFGYRSVKLMKQLAQGDKSGLPKNGVEFIPHRFITRDGKFEGKDCLKATEYKTELNKMLGK